MPRARHLRKRNAPTLGTRCAMQFPTVNLPNHCIEIRTNQPKIADHTVHATLRRQCGVTLVETMLVASVQAVTTSVVAPSFENAIQRRHLEGAAAQL